MKLCPKRDAFDIRFFHDGQHIVIFDSGINVAEIQVLTDDIINKIAAGEVVERPASVIKELIENALDAGASEVSVTLEGGGIAQMVVADNGRGMDEQDLRLSVRRHATSKIRCVDDLTFVKTNGFRGEALAAIAAVAEVAIASATKDGAGCRLVATEPQSVEPWTGRRGTQVTVERLFSRIPAREKFLKKPATEFAYCFELVQGMALARPDVGWRLYHKAKQIADWPAVAKGNDAAAALRERWLQVFPEFKEVIPFSNESDFGTATGLVSPPGADQAHSKYLFTFVNGRLVRDKHVRFAVLRGFHGHLLKGRYPCGVVNLALPAELVDVNVHPAKTEVRFQYAEEVSQLIALGIRQALRQADWIMPTPKMEFNAPAYTSPTKSVAAFSRSYAPPTRSDISHESFWSTPVAGGFNPSQNPSQPDEPTEEAARQVYPGLDLASCEYLGAINRCILLFAWQESLVAVDQHAFHERILYERLTNNPKLLLTSQQLLLPEAIDAPATVIGGIEPGRLAEFGFRVAKVSDTTLEVTAIPALLTGKDYSAAILELGSGLETTETLHHDALATMACHAAVRAGEELGPSELKQLIAESSTVDFYANCPHGRRVMRVFAKADLEHWFDRK
jgi:DNA mismatch repair protein MutL